MSMVVLGTQRIYKTFACFAPLFYFLLPKLFKGYPFFTTFATFLPSAALPHFLFRPFFTNFAAMILQSLNVTNYRNIGSASLEFSSVLNGFLGSNGMGKTNLLDAIHYMSIGKSHTGSPDQALIRAGEDFLTVRADYLRRGQPEQLTLGISSAKRKSLRRGGKEYRRLSEHLGLFPLVMLSPGDSDLIQGSPEERRRFLDIIISQTDATYLDRLIRYNESLRQRNRMLADSVTDKALFEAVEAAMIPAAEYITRRRDETTVRFATIFNDYYRAVTGTDEDPSVTYQSHCATHGKTLELLLDERRRRDMAVGYTTAGPHRDDLMLSLAGMPAKTAASQGQQKTFAIAMRLAQYRFLSDATGLKPLLLLDDIFDKLDSSRVANIIALLKSNGFGQIFITDTNRQHLDAIIEQAGLPHALWEVNNGEFNHLEPDHQ